MFKFLFKGALKSFVLNELLPVALETALIKNRNSGNSDLEKAAVEAALRDLVTELKAQLNK